MSNEALMKNDEITNHPAGQCLDCGSIECDKHELGNLPIDDEEGRLAWMDAVSTCNSKELSQRRQQFIKLREAIDALPKYGYWSRQDGPQAENANAARAYARQLVGLKEP